MKKRTKKQPLTSLKEFKKLIKVFYLLGYENGYKTCELEIKSKSDKILEHFGI